MVDICKKILVSCKDSYAIKYGMHVNPGMTIGDCEVITCIPRDCVVGLDTEFVSSRKIKTKLVEYESNVAIYELDDNGVERNIYVYPKKIYQEFIKLYIEPIVRGEPPITSGALITGAPGIGKSTIARLVAQMYGIPYQIVNISEILSKYVGESEKNIDKYLQYALRNPPMILIFDDAEAYLFPRELADKGRSGGTAESMANVQNIMFQRLQEMYDKKVPSLVIATTNIKESLIDSAFNRFGRFGDPIFIPLQDYEATYLVLKFILNDEQRARELARKYVNAGLPISDVINLGLRIKNNLPAEIKPKSGRGYRRLYFERVHEFDMLFENVQGRIVEKEGYLPQGIITNNGRIHITTSGSDTESYVVSEDVGVAVGTQLCYSAGRSVIYAVDLQVESLFGTVKESVHTANITNSCLIISSHINQDIQRYVHLNLNSPLIFVGKDPVYIPAYVLDLESLSRMFDHLMIMNPNIKTRESGFMPIIKALVNMMGINVNIDQYASKINNIASTISQLECVLNLIISTRNLNDVVLSRAVALCK